MGKRQPHECSDRELLIRIDERTEAQGERLENHGKRLSRLEKWRWLLVGAVTAVGGLGAFVIMNLDNLMRIIR